MVKIFIGSGKFGLKKLYKKDKRRLKKRPNLNTHKGFLLSRALKYHFRLKDHICISHKDEICAIAYSKRKVGVDMEHLKPRNFSAIMEFCFSEYEKVLFKNSDDKILVFYQIFTAKEAYIKYKNLGFSELKSVKMDEILANCNVKYFLIGEYIICLVLNKFL